MTFVFGFNRFYRDIDPNFQMADSNFDYLTAKYLERLPNPEYARISPICISHLRTMSA